MSKISEVATVSNHLLRAGFQLSEWEHRIIAAAAAQIDRGSPIETDHPIILRASDMADLFDSPPANIYKSLAAAAKRLMRRVISIKYAPDGRPEVVREKLFHWVTESDYARDLNAVSLIFSPRVQPYLVELSREFAQFRVDEIVRLSGKWAPRLFQLLMSFRSVGHFEATGEELAFHLELSSAYKNDMNQLKFRLLIPAVEQIRVSLPELGLTMSERRAGRRIIAFQFAFVPSRVARNRAEEPDLAGRPVEQKSQKQKNQPPQPADGRDRTAQWQIDKDAERARRRVLRQKLRDITDVDW